MQTAVHQLFCLAAIVCVTVACQKKRPDPKTTTEQTKVEVKSDVGVPHEDEPTEDDDELKSVTQKDFDGDGTVDTLTSWSFEGHVSECVLETSRGSTSADSNYSIGSPTVWPILEATNSRLVTECVVNAPLVEKPNYAFRWWLQAIKTRALIGPSNEWIRLKTTWEWQTSERISLPPDSIRVPIGQIEPWMKDESDPIEWKSIDALWLRHEAVDSGGKRFEFKLGTLVRVWNQLVLERENKWAWVFTSDALWGGTNSVRISGVGFVDENIWLIHNSDEAVPILWILKDGEQLGIPFLWKTGGIEALMDDLLDETREKPMRVVRQNKSYVITIDGTDVTATVPIP